MMYRETFGLALIGWLLLGPMPARADEKVTGFLNRAHKGTDGAQQKKGSGGRESFQPLAYP
jgi:hypothetical protein